MSNNRALIIAAAVMTLATARSAWAQGEVATVAEVVNVIDAFDGEDRFDFTFRARYGFELERVKLTQQCEPGAQAGCVPGRSGVLAFRDVGRYTRERHVLTFDAVFGLYRDLEVYLSVPLVLLDRRRLDFLQEGPQSNHDTNSWVFRFPFQSADRSGVDQLNVGFSWLPFSQQRESTLPNWLINVEGRFAVGERLTPSCNRSDGAVEEVTDPGDDGLWFTDDDESSNANDCVTGDSEDPGPGISERTNDLRIRMTLSRRYGILEPYIGFMVHLMFPEEGDPRYGTASDLPIYAETHFGLELVPWERPERQQFFRIGLHFVGGWNSETLYRGPLFDVLGTNPNMDYGFDPTSGRTACDPDGSDPDLRDCDPADNPREANAGRGARRPFDGMTREEGRGTFAGRLTLTLQAAQYVKFALGVGIAYDQEHFITFTDECRVPRGNESAEPSGPCGPPVSGIHEPEHRDQIDDLGRRIRAEETTIFDTYFTVFVQF